MMDIKRIWGENFCQYKKFSYELVPGLTLILGLNGTGKSNLIRALYLGLEGECYGAPNLVRDGHLKGFVALGASTLQGDLVIERKLKHNERTRGTKIAHSVDAGWLEQPLAKKGDVNAFLSPLIGASATALEHVCFALQDKFDSLMTMDHAPRVRILNALMGMERAQKIREVLKECMALIPDYMDKSQQVTEVCAGLEKSKIDLARACEALQVSEGKMTDAVKVAYDKARSILSKPRSDIRDDALKHNKALKKGKEAEIALKQDEIDAIVVGDYEQPDFTGYEVYRKYMNQKSWWQEASKKHGDLSKELKELEEAPEPDASELDAITAMRHDLSKLEDKIDSYGTGVCPTCKRDYDEKLDVADLRKEHTEKNTEVTERQTAFNEATAAHGKWKGLVATLNKDLATEAANLEKYLKGMREHQDGSTFDLETYQENCEKMNQQCENSRKKDTLVTEMFGLKDALGKLDVRIAQLEGQDVATPEERTWALTMSKAYEDVDAEIQAKKTAIEVLETSEKVQKQRLADLERETEQTRRSKEGRELLDFSRGKLHPEFLPRLASQGTAQSINKAMLTYLKLFSFPYGFRLNEELDFVVDFDTSRDHPVSILSGGEKVRAAMAMRFGLMDVFGSGCGLMVLDEPTTGQDKEAESALVDVLGTAAAYFKKRNIKILCPTHNTKLESAADAVITIGG